MHMCAELRDDVIGVTCESGVGSFESSRLEFTLIVTFQITPGTVRDSRLPTPDSQLP